MLTRVAIIGCGAVAKAHVPTVKECKRSRLTVLCDVDVERARALAQEHDVEHVLEDWNQVVGLADAAIVALPHHLHARASIELLKLGIHVLVEKPMGMSTVECNLMNAAAAEGHAVLAVGLVSRWFGAARHVKRMLDSHLLGRIHHFDVREGMVYSWPVTSDFLFRRAMGGGVLADLGAHVLDLLLYWLGDYESVDYYDDAAGGAESDCELGLVMKSGAVGVVQLSRTRDLRNTWILEGDQGTLEVMRRHDAELAWRVAGGDVVLDGSFRKDGRAEDPLECFRLQWADFLDAIANRRLPFVSGVEGYRGVELIERCRRGAKRRPHTWEWF